MLDFGGVRALFRPFHDVVAPQVDDDVAGKVFLFGRAETVGRGDDDAAGDEIAAAVELQAGGLVDVDGGQPGPGAAWDGDAAGDEAGGAEAARELAAFLFEGSGVVMGEDLKWCERLNSVLNALQLSWD